MTITLDRLTAFLALFAFVYFLESIGGSYLVSAVQNIERQFQIPSKLSGFIISASDLSYIPTVIFISYLGGKGNRAKWIGAGTVLMAAAWITTSTPNFLFPVKAPDLNFSDISRQMVPTEALLAENASLSDMFSFQPIRDRIPMAVREAVLQRVGGHVLAPRSPDAVKGVPFSNLSESLYSIDEPLMSEALREMHAVLTGEEADAAPLKEVLRRFLQNRSSDHEKDMKTIRRAAIAPFAFCGKLVNELREALKDLRCHRETNNFGPLTVIFMAMLALGIGRTMPWSLGVPLIDDNVKRKSMPVYLAGMTFVKILGPITGFLIGSACNKLYYTSPTPAGLTPNDPTWIGRWWLGFLIIGFVMTVPSVALYFFPTGQAIVSDQKREHARIKKRKSLRLFDKHIEKEEEEEQDTLEKIKAFARSYRDMFKSKIYIGSVVGRVLDILAFRGYMVFLPKYLENHYGLPQYKVQMYMAAFGVFGFALGTVTGGAIVRKFRLNGRRAAMFVLIISLLNLGVYAGKSFLGCHSIVNTVGRNGISTGFNYSTTCNSECGCNSAKLFPVCDETGQIFYSPCHAGCRHVSVHDLATYKLEFSDCDCVPGGIVKKEFCHDDCGPMIVAFFVTVILGAFAAGTGVVPGMLILLRSVPMSTRSMSLGFQGFMISLFGTLPSPVLWGALIDSACLVWDQTCHHRGACAIYDPKQLRMRMHFMYVGIRLLSCVTDLFVWFHAKHLNILEEEPEDANKSELEKAEKETAEGMESVPMTPM